MRSSKSFSSFGALVDSGSSPASLQNEKDVDSPRNANESNRNALENSLTKPNGNFNFTHRNESLLRLSTKKKKSSFARNLSSFLKLPGSSSNSSLRSFRSENSNVKDCVYGSFSRIYTHTSDTSTEKLKRPRNKMGRFAEPLHEFEDQFGNETLSVGVAQEIGTKDQDRYDIRTKDYPYCYAAVFDGHGLTSYAADLCMNELYDYINGSPENARSSKRQELPEDEAIINAYQRLDDTIRKNPEIEPRTGACAVTVMMQLQEAGNFIDADNDDESLGLDIDSRGSDTDARIGRSGDLCAKVAWTGDCRALLISETGDVVELTKDHRLHVNENERLRIEKELEKREIREGLVDTEMWKKTVEQANKVGIIPRAHSFVGRRTGNDGQVVGNDVIFAHTNGLSLQITRSIGDKNAARSIIATPEIRNFILKKNESSRLILASDGLFDVYDCKDIARLVAKTSNPRKAAKLLSSKAKNRRLYSGKSIDDITVVVLDLW
mmetsp:Transcript_28729/g.35295  ORF Transcript_28729/g.35295 Transcript_28729/m.35295 type:complete len:493 (+) Transcript_28729:48-1526(+)